MTDLGRLERVDLRARRIIGYHPMNELTNKSDWEELQVWMVSALEQMQQAFAHRVKNLTSEAR